GPATPPPRPVTDIISLLDQRQLNDSESAFRRVAEAAPPEAGVDTLATFYLERGLAAGRIGRAKQEIDDLTRSYQYFWQTVSPVSFINHSLATAEERGGNLFHHIRYLREISRTHPISWSPHARLAIAYASIGDGQAAAAALSQAAHLFNQSAYFWYGSDVVPPFVQAQAELLDVTGRHAEAEALSRNIIAWRARYRQLARSTQMDEMHALLARTLIRQGRVAEAENEPRE